MTEKMTNEELLNRLRESHPDSDRYFEILFNRYEKRLIQFFQKRHIDLDQARDLSQLTFIQLFERRERYRPNSSADAWVFIVARSQFLDFVRSNKKENENKSLYLEFESLNNLVNPYKEYGEEDFMLQDLTPEELKLLSDRFEKGLTFKEMAANWGVSAQSLRKRMSRLYQYLKKNRGSLS